MIRAIQLMERIALVSWVSLIALWVLLAPMILLIFFDPNVGGGRFVNLGSIFIVGGSALAALILTLVSTIGFAFRWMMHQEDMRIIRKKKEQMPIYVHDIESLDELIENLSDDQRAYLLYRLKESRLMLSDDGELLAGDTREQVLQQIIR